MIRAQVAMILAFLGLLLVVDIGTGLKVGSFYVNTLGKSKIDKSAVVESIVEVICRYDVVLIAGVRDVSGETVLPTLLTEINNSSGCNYTYVASNPVGRTKQKETFAFFYKVNRIKLVESYTYDDQEDDYERDPFAILISSITATATGETRFFLIGVHLKSSDVCTELGALDKVYDEVSSIFNTTEGLILGNLNSDCCHLSGCPFQDLAIANEPFEGLIDFSADTTTSASFCAYDRIIAGGNIRHRIVPYSAQAYRFDQHLNLSQEQTQAVSDHYPVEVDIADKERCLETVAVIVGKSKRGYAESVGPHILQITANDQNGNVTLQDKTTLPDVFGFDLRKDFGFTECLQPKDIHSVCIIPGTTDAWILSSVTTFAYDCFDDVALLTNDHNIDVSIDQDNRGNGEIFCLTKAKRQPK